MRKPDFCICQNKDADQLRGYSAKLISAFVFATRIVQSLYFLNPKFQASSHFLWLYRPVCVGPGRKPRRPVFSERGSNLLNKLQKNNNMLGTASYLIAFFFIQFNVPFKIISLIETSQSIGGAKWEYPRKTT